MDVWEESLCLVIVVVVIACQGLVRTRNPTVPPPKCKHKPYPFWMGGAPASLIASIAYPIDLTKVRLQTSRDKGMMQSLQNTIRTAGVGRLFDGISGTLMRQMSYSVRCFW